MKWISKRQPRAVADPIREAYRAREERKAAARMGADTVTPIGIAANAVVGDAYPYYTLGATIVAGVVGTLRSGPIWGLVWLVGANIASKLAASALCNVQGTSADCGRENWIF